MHPAQPSRTALRVALRRAAHQLYDRPTVFHDPISLQILTPTYLAELHRTAHKLHKPSSVALRAFLVARSRFAEDTLAASLPRTTQYVLLGAGLDTFAYRNPHPNLRVFEVDHPATQLWKRDLLHQTNIPIPETLTIVPVDFEHQTLATQLHAAGLDPAQPTLFAWLGVVPYLTLPAFRATLAFIATHPPGSGLVLDYALPRSILTPNEQLERDSLASRVALAGEPFQLFFTPAGITAELTLFRHLEDLGTPEINARYFPHRTDLLRTRGHSARLLRAHL